MTDRDKYFMREAIKLAEKGMNANSGGPFGTVIVKNDEIIAKAYNEVTSLNDPTAHAEIIAIRKACKKLNSFHLDDCIIYTSCEPCPMCLGAIYWAQPKMVFYACTKEDAKEIDFDDQRIYDEMKKDMADRQIEFVELIREEALPNFKKWKEKPDKIKY